ncbi:MAG TPA: hypothetical protein IAD03_01485 [Candidatus Caccousia stercoris]|uniref:SGNH hydrolase-type esterase domain-containing protein n=1 Tax=Candidatus Caccousia stercoris TaxID=2840723 RepID=A0A9D1K154_9FIRM|nr:hypothetical protein [Candidatus Caccousia stercoris]
MKVQREKHYKKKNLLRRRILIVCSAVLIIAAIGGGAVLAGSALAQSIVASDASSAASAPPSSQDQGAAASGGESSQAAQESTGDTASQADASEPVVSDAPVSEAGTDSSAPQAVEPGDYSDAAFIGDSRTEALKTYGLLKNATYYTYKGLKVDTVFTEPCIDEGGTKMTVMDAISLHQYNRVYISLGVNELGWVSTDIFIEDYGKIIDTLKETQPNATIYVQAILPVSQKKSEQDKIYNNPRINEFNTLLEQMAADKGVVYLPVNTAVMDETGSLPVGASTDGVHPNIDYCRKWVAYLDENS